MTNYWRSTNLSLEHTSALVPGRFLLIIGALKCTTLAILETFNLLLPPSSSVYNLKFEISASICLEISSAQSRTIYRKKIKIYFNSISWPRFAWKWIWNILKSSKAWEKGSMRKGDFVSPGIYNNCHNCGFGIKWKLKKWKTKGNRKIRGEVAGFRYQITKYRHERLD